MSSFCLEIGNLNCMSAATLLDGICKWRIERVFLGPCCGDDDAGELKRFVASTKYIYKPVVIPCYYFALEPCQKNNQHFFFLVDSKFAFIKMVINIYFYANSCNQHNWILWKKTSYFTHLHEIKYTLNLATIDELQNFKEKTTIFELPKTLRKQK